MTLIVYLDTQDYINLFNEADDGPNHQILSDLMIHREQGNIKIGFSFATIMEFITKPDEKNRSERVRRGQLIKDICGPNAFPYLTDLPKGAHFPNGGSWMLSKNDNVFSAKKFRLRMHKTIIEELAKTEGLNRQQRRTLGRKASMSELVQRTGSTWGRKRSDYGNFPVSDEIIESRIIERFMKGQCSDLEFEERLNAWFSDPVEFSRIAYDYSDKPNMIQEFFGTSTNGIEKEIITIQDLASQSRDLNNKILEARKNLTELGLDKREIKEMTKQTTLKPVDLSNKIEEKLAPVLGKERVGHFGHYFIHAMRPEYAFKRSDVMDIMQMCYAYDCDLFRCDKAMADTYKNYTPFEGKLVARFKELPNRISSLIKQ